MFTALFTTAKLWRQLKCPLIHLSMESFSLEGEDTVCMHTRMYIHYRILHSHKRERDLAVYDGMDEPRWYCAKRRKSNKDKYHGFHLHVSSRVRRLSHIFQKVRCGGEHQRRDRAPELESPSPTLSAWGDGHQFNPL